MKLAEMDIMKTNHISRQSSKQRFHDNGKKCQHQSVEPVHRTINTDQDQEYYEESQPRKQFSLTQISPSVVHPFLQKYKANKDRRLNKSVVHEAKVSPQILRINLSEIKSKNLSRSSTQNLSEMVEPTNYSIITMPNGFGQTMPKSPSKKLNRASYLNKNGQCKMIEEE